MAQFRVLHDTRRADTCRSCKAPVTFFAMAKSGNFMPFDGDPVYVKTEQSADNKTIGVIDGSAFPSHFATCPQASNWRKRSQVSI